MSDPRKRTSSWQMIHPGLYVDPEGCGHIFPDEVLATLGFPYTEENYQIVVSAFRELCDSVRPDMPITVTILQHERQFDA